MTAPIPVDADDLVGSGHARALDDIEADTAESKHHHIGARLDLGGVDDRADAGGDAAADVADLVERRVLADFRDRDLRQHGVIRKGRCAHVVVDGFAAERKTRGAVGHQALALGSADRGAEIGLARKAGRALPAFRRVQRNNVIAFFHTGDAATDIDNHARALMAEDRRKQPFGVSARQCEFVGVANAGGLDLDHHLALARPLELHGGYFQRLSRGGGDGGANIHGISSCRYTSWVFMRVLIRGGFRYVISHEGPRAIGLAA